MVQKRAGPYKIPINTWEGMMKIEKKKKSAFGKNLILVSHKVSMDATISKQKFKLKQNIYIFT